MGALVGAGAREETRAAAGHRQAERARHAGGVRAAGRRAPAVGRGPLSAGDRRLQLGHQALAQVHAAHANLYLYSDVVPRPPRAGAEWVDRQWKPSWSWMTSAKFSRHQSISSRTWAYQAFILVLLSLI